MKWLIILIALILFLDLGGYHWAFADDEGCRCTTFMRFMGHKNVPDMFTTDRWPVYDAGPKVGQMVSFWYPAWNMSHVAEVEIVQPTRFLVLEGGFKDCVPRLRWVDNVDLSVIGFND